MTKGRFRLKSVIATATTMLLALGVVTVGVAGPASAHANVVSAAVSCTPDYKWQIKWTVTNDYNDSETVKTADAPVVVGTTIAATNKASTGLASFVETVATPVAKKVSVTGVWKKDNFTMTASGSIKVTDFVGQCSAPKPPVVQSTGLYLYKKLDSTKDASWPNSGPQTKITTWDGWSFKTIYPSTLPSNVCGPGWGVQQDEITGPQSLFPDKIQYPNNGGFAAGVLHAARHDNLSTLVKVPDCAPIPHVTVTTGVCYANGDHSSANVYVALSNTGNAPVTFTSSNGINVTLQGGESKNVEASPIWNAGGSFTIVATGTGFTQTFPITIPAFDDCRIIVVPPTPHSNIAAVCSATGASTDVFVSNDFTPAKSTVGAPFAAQIFVNGVLKDTVTVASGTVASKHYDFASNTGVYTVVVKVDGKTIAEKVVDSACALATEADPSPQTCVNDELVDGQINVLLNAHLVYKIDGVVVTQANTTVTPGSHTVTAELADPSGIYVLSGQSSWTFTSAAFDGECGPPTLALVTPTASSKAITCTAPGSYTLDSVEGVTWLVEGVAKAAGTYPVSSAATVHAVATVDPAVNGFEQDAQTSWTFTFTDPADCGDLTTHPLVTPVVSHVNRTCTANGSYTLTAVEGVVYTVNGTVQAAGTYPVSTAKTVAVVASTVSSDFGFEEGAQTTWNLVFTDPANCGDLTTLAFTGSNGTLAGGLLLGLIFVMFGAGVITVSRIRKRTS